MQAKQANSVINITNLNTGESGDYAIVGSGQQAVNNARQAYPNSRNEVYNFILKGHLIDGKFIPLDTTSNYKL